MAQVVLSAVGTALGGPIGGAIGRFAGSLIDNAAINSLLPARQVGPRLTGLQLQSTAEGSPMAAVFGRARIAGQVIWAARFKEKRAEQSSGGGKGGPKTVSYSYSLSFAVAVCEGPIDGIGRVWADGSIMDMTGVTMRTYTGAPDQTPDPLIEAIEGSAPAYCGVAYVVFEDLPLADYGNRPPQLNFEVFHRPAVQGSTPLEAQLGSVCLIPGAGEFVYATTPVLRRDGLTVTTAQNVNNSVGKPDIEVSLDQLQAQLPNVKTVTLVVAWFGTDLRCGECRIMPGVEEAAKFTLGMTWSAGGVDRSGAHLISQSGGGPAYGGTPADASVIQAIGELKARGYKVVLYPFVLMDVPAGNVLPDPYGGATQGAYPWRGRITCHPAAGQAGTVDKTSAAGTQVSAFFGAAASADFSISGGGVSYHGPDEWSFRRFILHHAALAEAAGGVDAFLIGSEMAGLTTIRSDASTYPAVGALKTLAADCAGMLGSGTEVGYAADWTEYYGHQPRDGSGDVVFHLDPLWSDPHLSFVGVDWYAPLADWRDGDDHVDALAGYTGPYDPAYLAANVAGGEGFDWYYASSAARLAQVRTPITDGAYGEPWVYRPKDLVSWWSNAHHDRPGGVRSASATGWTPGMKPVRFIEFGCPAVDKGSNAPNLFVDTKSSESALPPFSSGGRDDLAQRRALEALLFHYGDPSLNPLSTVYGGAMIAPADMAVWCWDARPFPDFPARSEVWADASNWSRGHWLNGRMGALPLADVMAAVMQRGGVAPLDYDLGAADGLLAGYVLDQPMSLADALKPLTDTYPFDLAEREGMITAVDRDGDAGAVLAEADLALPEDQSADVSASRSLKPLADVVRVRFIDDAADYQTGAVAVRALDGGGGGTDQLDLPIVMLAADADRAGKRQLRKAMSERDGATAYVGLAAALRAEPGDIVALEGQDGLWRVERADADETPRLELLRVEAPDADAPAASTIGTAPALRPQGPPALFLLDLPPLEGEEDDARPLAAVSASPWRGFDISAGPSEDALTLRASAAEPSIVGQTLNPLTPGPLFRFDHASRLLVSIEGGVLSSATEEDVFAGANAAAVQSASGEWEVLQFLTAAPVSPGVYALSGLLRGQAGSDPAMRAGAAAGSAFVLLDGDPVRWKVAQSERTLPLTVRAAPSGGPPGGLAVSEKTFTWMGIQLRPFAPCHASLQTLEDGTLRFGWIRRARLGGDAWDAEPPLSEAAELYRLDIFKAGAVIRSITTNTPGADYTPAAQSADFTGGVPRPLTIEVRQISDVFGPGAPLARSL